jgi:predicted transcriptional regulator of viral defense system
MRHPVIWTSKDRIRATAIGETYRDTLNNPAWCGGIDAVIGTWRKHAGEYREAIIETISESDEKILRVRAGYLLDEVLGIKDPRMEAWIADAQRGSSRKLDAAAPYAGNFSARWMLSINVPDPSLPSTTK